MDATDATNTTPVLSVALMVLVVSEISVTNRISVDSPVVAVAMAATLATAKISVTRGAEASDSIAMAAVSGMPVLSDAITMFAVSETAATNRMLVLSPAIKTLAVSETSATNRISVDRSVITVVIAATFAIARIAVTSGTGATVDSIAIAALNGMPVLSVAITTLDVSETPATKLMLVLSAASVVSAEPAMFPINKISVDRPVVTVEIAVT